MIINFENQQIRLRNPARRRSSNLRVIQNIRFGHKNIEIPVKKVSGLGKTIGLMFKKKTTRNLLFEFNEKTNLRIHSYFVFFDFLAIWLDDKNKILEWKIIKSFTLSVRPEKSFFKLIEIPFNKKNEEITKAFVGKRKI